MLRGLIYEADAQASSLVAAAMRRCGFEVVGEVETVADAVRTSVATGPHVVVVDVDVAGVLGLGVVPVLSAAAPSAAVVVVSSYSLDLAAVEAGAYALVGLDDPRQLDRCLTAVAERAALSGAGSSSDAASA